MSAVAVCPEYIKGHHRLAACLKANGRASEAADIETQLGIC